MYSIYSPHLASIQLSIQPILFLTWKLGLVFFPLPPPLILIFFTRERWHFPHPPSFVCSAAACCFSLPLFPAVTEGRVTTSCAAAFCLCCCVRVLHQASDLLQVHDWVQEAACAMHASHHQHRSRRFVFSPLQFARSWS
jgi:hypothetical protein